MGKVVDLYAAGPPCQFLPIGGVRRALGDPRTRLYMHAIFAIELARQGLFPVGNAANLQYVENGKSARSFIDKLRLLGHNVYSITISTRDRGLLQNMARFWIIGIGGGTQIVTSKRHRAIQPVHLSDLLIPKNKTQGTLTAGCELS